MGMLESSEGMCIPTTAATSMLIRIRLAIGMRMDTGTVVTLITGTCRVRWTTTGIMTTQTIGMATIATVMATVTSTIIITASMIGSGT